MRPSSLSLLNGGGLIQVHVHLSNSILYEICKDRLKKDSSKIQEPRVPLRNTLERFK